MSDEPRRTDVHPTDEPDGTPAFAASTRPVGESVTAGDAPDVAADDEFADAPDPDPGPPPLRRALRPDESRAGYDVDDASGSANAAGPR